MPTEVAQLAPNHMAIKWEELNWISLLLPLVLDSHFKEWDVARTEPSKNHGVKDPAKGPHSRSKGPVGGRTTMCKECSGREAEAGLE